MPSQTDRHCDSISQAIFTSAETDRLGGYHVVAATPAIPAEDLMAVAAWCPSHDGLLAARIGATSVSFHPLPSGDFCVARTQTAGAEYSQRGGERLYTHCLLVPPATLLRFSNNPLALLRAAVARGVVGYAPTAPTAPTALPAVLLPGRANPVDATAVTRLGRLLERGELVSLIDMALSSPVLGFPLIYADRIISGLVNCLPIAMRSGFALATGLRFSMRRPFRWLAVDDDPIVQRHLARHSDVAVFNPDAPPAEAPATPCHPWATFAADCVCRGKLSALRAEVAQMVDDCSVG